MALKEAKSSAIPLQKTEHESSTTPSQEEDNGLGVNEYARRESLYPPADHGKHAWFFLAACFFVDALTWGFPLSFGVFEDYYSTHEPFVGSNLVPLIGTCAMGIMYLDVPLVMGLQLTYPRFSRWGPILGLLLMSASLIASSFSQKVGHLIASQGVLYAIGGSISYTPCIIYLDEWFIKRKGLAYGIMWSGTGLSGFSLPLLLEFFLHRYGFRATLRIWAVTMLLVTVPLAYFIKPRLPPKPKAAAAAEATTNTTPQVKRVSPFKLGFVLTRTFMLHQTENIVQGLGFFLPTIYLPTYARAIGASTYESALTLLLVNVASAVGYASMGWLTDHLHTTTCSMISAVGAGLGTFFLWGFATSLPVLLLFCIVYGLFAGPYSATWTGVMRQVSLEMNASGDGDGDDDDGEEKFDSTMVLAFLATGRGIGNITSGALSQTLIRGWPWRDQAIGGYGTGFGPLIVFTGVTAILSGSSFVCRKMGWI
ncbi:hypothetical protein E4U21_001564 [Claviceps maximensis]|nr:hypothetical protein E4U21_001564 [Claviceps maximensis]